MCISWRSILGSLVATTLIAQPIFAVDEDGATADRESVEASESDTNFFGLDAAPLTEPMVTDRPDFTESTDAVPWGHIQLELGYTLTVDKEDGNKTREHAAPGMLLRVGLVEDIELRLGWDGYSYEYSRETSRESTPGGGTRTVTTRDWAQGATDMSIGAKFKLVEQEDWIPHIGVITEITVPSGSSNVSSGDVEPGLILAWAYDITDNFGIAGNTGLFVLRDGTHQFLQTTSSLSAAFAIAEKLGSYVEYFGLYPDAISEDCAHHLNGGLTYQITDNLQLDWLIGFGLNEQAPDFFTGFGVSIRL